MTFMIKVLMTRLSRQKCWCDVIVFMSLCWFVITG